jgi:hypothetical protein
MSQRFNATHVIPNSVDAIGLRTGPIPGCQRIREGFGVVPTKRLRLRRELTPWARVDAHVSLEMALVVNVLPTLLIDRIDTSEPLGTIRRARAQ